MSWSAHSGDSHSKCFTLLIVLFTLLCISSLNHGGVSSAVASYWFLQPHRQTSKAVSLTATAKVFALFYFILLCKTLIFNPGICIWIISTPRCSSVIAAAQMHLQVLEGSSVHPELSGEAHPRFLMASRSRFLLLPLLLIISFQYVVLPCWMDWVGPHKPAPFLAVASVPHENSEFAAR